MKYRVKMGFVCLKDAMVIIGLLVILSRYLPIGAQSTPTPKGVVVKMSDGSTQDYTLGTWLTFQNGSLRVIFPLQYVNQLAERQADGTYKLNRPGRNIQVWRNGLMQTPWTAGKSLTCPPGSPTASVPLGDYFVVQVSGSIYIKPRITEPSNPSTYCDGRSIEPWAVDDIIQTAYIY